MAKFNTLEDYISTLNEQGYLYYKALLKVADVVDLDVKTKLFAGQLAFYVEANLKETFHSSPVIIVAFFHDHLNIFSNANLSYKDQLKQYKYTTKAAIQIYYNQEIEMSVLSRLFYDALRDID